MWAIFLLIIAGAASYELDNFGEYIFARPDYTRSVTFHCPFNHSGKVTWVKNTLPRTYFHNSSAILTIPNVYHIDQGDYTCITKKDAHTFSFRFLPDRIPPNRRRRISITAYKRTITDPIPLYSEYLWARPLTRINISLHSTHLFDTSYKFIFNSYDFSVRFIGLPSPMYFYISTPDALFPVYSMHFYIKENIYIRKDIYLPSKISTFDCRLVQNTTLPNELSNIVPLIKKNHIKEATCQYEHDTGRYIISDIYTIIIRKEKIQFDWRALIVSFSILCVVIFIFSYLSYHITCSDRKVKRFVIKIPAYHIYR